MSDLNSIVQHWRNEADNGNPAGPLFSHGEFAEADVVSAAEPTTLGGHPCSLCTGSHGVCA